MRKYLRSYGYARSSGRLGHRLPHDSMHVVESILFGMVTSSDGVSRLIFASLGLKGFRSHDFEYHKEMA